MNPLETDGRQEVLKLGLFVVVYMCKLGLEVTASRHMLLYILASISNSKARGNLIYQARSFLALVLLQ